MYNEVIHRSYIPFGVIIKYLLCSLCCTIYITAYFIHNSLYFLILHPYISPPYFSLSPLVTSLFSISVSLFLFYCIH